MTIHQDVDLYAGLFDGDERGALTLAQDRVAWVQIVRGKINVAGQQLSAGDGVTISALSEIVFKLGEDAEVLVFDIPA